MKIRILIATVAALGALASPAVASALPYHTDPAFTARYTDTNTGNCGLDFANPTAYGYTHEYVYWRILSATPDGRGGWSYGYGEWRRAWTSATGMIYGDWYLIGAWQDDYLTIANGYTRIWVTPGANRWIGYQLHYSSRSATHTLWLGAITCP